MSAHARCTNGPRPVRPLRFCGMAAALVATASHLPAQLLVKPPARSIVRMEQIVSALEQAKLPLEGAKVKRLAENIATLPDPRLEVRAIEPTSETSARVRMGCQAHEQCLPFYVAVDWDEPAAAAAALHAAGYVAKSEASHPGQQTRIVNSASNHPDHPIHEASRTLADDPADRSPHALGSDVHAGSHATLLIDGQRLHIKLPVICLENGVAGHSIRVTALDHKQTYVAEVVDATLLKGTL